MRKKSLKVAIASMVVLAMTVSALPVQVLKGLAGRSSVVQAEEETGYVELGTESIGDSQTQLFPSFSLFEYGFTEQIYTASEIGDITSIDAISFHVFTANVGVQCEVYMLDTELDHFDSSNDFVDIGDAEPVYVGSIDASQTGWICLPFSQVYAHDPDKNLLVAVVNTTGTSSEDYPYYSCYSDSVNCSLEYHTETGLVYPRETGVSTRVYAYKNCIRFHFGAPVRNLVFEANDGSDDIVERSVLVSRTTKLANPGFSCAGYYISGWNTESDGSGTAYSSADSFVMPDSDVVLYAQWKENPTITFMVNDGSEDSETLAFEPGTTVDLAQRFARYDYTNTGWNTEADGSGTAYSLADSFVMSDSDVVLYAQWRYVTFSYDFSTDPSEDGWIFIDYDNDGYNWKCGWRYYSDLKSHSGDKDSTVIFSQSYDNNIQNALYPDNWAISPSGYVDPNGTKTVTLWAVGQDSSWAAEHFAIYAAEADNVDLETLDLDQWQKISEEYVATGEYQMYTGDLSAFAGKRVYVAIRHFNCKDQFFLNIDDVSLPFYIPEPDPFGEALEGYSVSLDGDIAVNFYMSLAADVVDRGTAEMVFTVPNGEKKETQIVKLSDVGDPKEVNGKYYYVFKCKVSAKDMASDITAQMVDGELSGNVYTYSVKSYAEYLLDHSSGVVSPEIDLVKALLTYGSMAQNYFGVNTDNLAYESLAEVAEQVLSSITADTFSRFVVNEVTLPDDVVFEGATLSLKSETTLSLYFTSDVALSFTCEEYPIEVTTVGSYQVVRIRGIKAWDLGNAISVNVTSAAGTGTVRYSAMTYCYNVVNGEYDEKLQKLCKALFMYYGTADIVIHSML